MTRKELKEEEMVQEIMENFDWDKCSNTMKRIHWTWGIGQSAFFPQVDDLKRTAKYLIESAMDGAVKSKNLRPDEPYFSATGGLKASVTKNRNNHINYIHLEFILTDWESDGD